MNKWDNLTLETKETLKQQKLQKLQKPLKFCLVLLFKKIIDDTGFCHQQH